MFLYSSGGKRENKLRKGTPYFRDRKLKPEDAKVACQKSQRSWHKHITDLIYSSVLLLVFLTGFLVSQEWYANSLSILNQQSNFAVSLMKESYIRKRCVE